MIEPLTHPQKGHLAVPFFICAIAEHIKIRAASAYILVFSNSFNTENQCTSALTAIVSNLQPFLANVLIAVERLGCAVKHNGPVAHDQCTVRDTHGNGELLLNQQY